jgi:hypothetical protein
MICLSAQEMASAPEMDFSLKNEFIEDPAFSRRCKDLLIKRTERIDHKNRLSALRLKNEHLQKKTPKNKDIIRTSLGKNLLKLVQEIKMSEYNIETIEEDIIRRGCSGLIL